MLCPSASMGAFAHPSGCGCGGAGRGSTGVSSRQCLDPIEAGCPQTPSARPPWIDHRGRDTHKEKEMKPTRANRLAICLSMGAAAALAGPAAASAEGPVPGLPAQPCLSSSSLPVANPLPCPSTGTPAPGTGASGSAGANGSGASGSAGANGAATPGTTVNVRGKVKAKPRSTHRRRHVRRSARRRHRAVRHR
jgi:hypothetical protein